MCVSSLPFYRKVFNTWQEIKKQSSKKQQPEEEKFMLNLPSSEIKNQTPPFRQTFKKEAHPYYDRDCKTYIISHFLLSLCVPTLLTKQHLLWSSPQKPLLSLVLFSLMKDESKHNGRRSFEMYQKREARKNSKRRNEKKWKKQKLGDVLARAKIKEESNSGWKEINFVSLPPSPC